MPRAPVPRSRLGFVGAHSRRTPRMTFGSRRVPTTMWLPGFPKWYNAHFAAKKIPRISIGRKILLTRAGGGSIPELEGDKTSSARLTGVRSCHHRRALNARSGRLYDLRSHTGRLLATDCSRPGAGSSFFDVRNDNPQRKPPRTKLVRGGFFRMGSTHGPSSRNERTGGSVRGPGAG